MKQELGYTQYKFKYITDYAKQIDESATRMEFIWQNRDSFKDNVDIEVALDGCIIGNFNRSDLDESENVFGEE